MPANVTTTEPTIGTAQPQGTTAATPPDLAAVNGLWADLAAGNIAMPDFLTRLAEMQAAFLGS